MHLRDAADERPTGSGGTDGFFVDQADATAEVAAAVSWVTADDVHARDRVDASKLALIGHGLGAKIALLATLDTVTTASTVIGLDPVDGGTPSAVPERMADVTFPSLLLGETWNAGQGSQPCTPAAENFEAFYASAPTGLPTQRMTFDKASINSWVGNPACTTCQLCSDPADVDHDRVKRLTKKYVTAWLEIEVRAATDAERFFDVGAIAADGLTGARK